jgi:heme oxygenase
MHHKMLQRVITEDLRTALKRETAPLHLRLETRMATLGTFDTPAAYSAWLIQMQRLHALFARDHDAGAEQLGLDPLSADLMKALASDTGIDVPAAPRSCVPDAHAIGVAYVFEGSAVGGRLLMRRKACLGDVPEAYLRLLVARSYARWPTAGRRLETLCARADVGAIHGARIVFKAFLRAFEALRA